MPEDPVPVPAQPTSSGPTPTGYVRQPNGSFLWKAPTPEELQAEFTQYQILDLIGRGGMGAVYRAWQTSLERPVAIKILPPDLNSADTTFVERFKREAKTMASLSHPAIIAVHDAGETSSGLLFFVMDFVEGTDVHDMLREQGHLKSRHALAIAAHVCDALQYAHSHGVMHRDIKPANIVVDTEGRVRVADFGLAKSLQVDPGLTRPDIGVGTPDYAAPEAFATGMTTDQRSDIYSVGVVLYQMLTGVVPRGNFEPPSKVVQGIDPRFDAIVLRAMKSEPEKRYQSASEVRQALDEIISSPVIQAGQESSPAIPKHEMGAVGRKGVSEKAVGKELPWGPLISGVAVVLIAAGIFVYKAVTMPERPRSSEIALVPPKNETDTPAASSGDPAPPKPKEAPKAVTKSSAPTPPKETEKQTEVKVAVKEAELTVAEPSLEPPPPAKSVTTMQSGQEPASVKAEMVVEPGKTASDSPPVPSAPASDASKPAAPAPVAIPETTAKPQWQKVEWTQEELNRRVGSGLPITIQDGWWHLPPSGVFYLPKEAEAHQSLAVGCRGRVTNNDLGLKISFTYGGRSLYLSVRNDRTQIVFHDPLQPTRAQILAEVPLLPALKANDEVVVEFAVAAHRYAGRVGPVLVGPVSDDRVAGKIPYVMSQPETHSWVKDIEYLVLDGIPEAEALRIIGVDEKGNDLRALAAKQEEEQKEQSKQADTIAAIPELKQLHEQFLKLQAEQVAAPFEAEVAKLNTNYLGALDRAIEDEKKAGHLDGVLALEGEKKLIADKEPLPEDDEKTPANLKKLRAIYRETLGKSEAKKTADLKKLTDSLTVSLKQLESELTRKNRVPDAKVVREYRERLGQGQEPLVVSKSLPPEKGAGSTRRGPELAGATKEKPFVNSLGMKFVPVKGTDVLFCIHETRWKDYAAYAEADPGVATNWKNQTIDGFCSAERPEDHPVTNVNWDEATSFCRWLSQKESTPYRLPTDREWSVAVGLGRKEKWRKDTTPESNHDKIKEEYPWGSSWPPPRGAGNYSDQTRKAKAPNANGNYLDGYDDSFPTTSPVMSFAPSEFGLYDIGGNVCEWVEDWWNSANTQRVLRGGSCLNFSRNHLWSSSRNPHPQDYKGLACGFRVVLDLSTPSEPALASLAPKPEHKPQSPVATTSKVSEATKDKPFENSLGMKFVPVKGTDVLFCIHETRYKDYAAYAEANPGINAAWQNQSVAGFTVAERKEDHPVVWVNLEDAIAFCRWLSEREKKIYRLPTDREWSVAVGLGRTEKWRKGDTPETISKDLHEFPWGQDWPPPKGAGNYSDQSRKAKAPSNNPAVGYIDGYDDGFPTTAPVMSFPPNEFGLCDLGGNVWEFVGDSWNAAKRNPVSRGGSLDTHSRSLLLSSYRNLHSPEPRHSHIGFRIVFEVSGS